MMLQFQKTPIPAFVKIGLVAMVALVVVAGCKAPKAARPDEFYSAEQLQPEPSVINIPLRFHKAELLKALNDRIGDQLYEDSNLKDDGMAIRAKKQENISIDITDKEIKYRVPVDLWVKKDVTISTVEAEGAIALEFVTKYNILPDWSLHTETQLVGHKWLKEPVLKLGFADLPVTAISNLLLNQVKASFAKSIDKEVKSVFDLRKEMELTWKGMHDPFLLSEEYRTWLLLNPQTVGMAPLRTNGNTVESTVVIVTRPSVYLGEKPMSTGLAKLPHFAFSEALADNFTLFLNTEVPFGEAERLSRQNMVGEVFSYKNKQVRVEDVGLYGQGNKLVVRTNLKGSYNGDVYLIAEPAYDAAANKIELKNVEFDFSSQKALLKTASWLFKGPMKKHVQENLNFFLNYNLDDARNAIQEQLRGYELSPGIQLNGLLEELTVSNVYIAANAIKVRIGLKGKLNLDVKGLGF